MKKTLSVILALLMALSVFAFAVSAEGAAINGANWMSTIKGSVPVTAINMPGTHDSMTQYVPASIIARTQTMSVSEQLYSGVRYFDMRTKTKNGELIGVHGVTECKESYGLFSKTLILKDVVEICKSFLSENSGETILFLLRSEGEDGTALFSKFYDDCIAPSPESWFIENRIPTLSEVRGKIVLLRSAKADRERFDNTNSGINFERYPHIGSTDGDDFRTCAISDISGYPYAYMHIQDSYKLEGDKKIKTIKNFLESDLDMYDFNICCTNAIGGKPAQMNAQGINAFLMSYDFTAGKTYGIIAMDFATAELCKKVYMTNSPLMTKEPAQTNIPSFPEKYGFMGRVLEAFRDALLKILLMFM